MNSENSKNVKLKAFKAAFPNTIPVMTGFLFLGMAYGIYAKVSGFGPLYPLSMCIVIFGGSLEFVAVSMLLAPFNPLQTFIMALLIQARHLFYGISMLDKYKDMGKKKLYLVYALCDESFSINFTADVPEGVDRGWFYFFVSILDQSYWFMGTAIGVLLGSVITFNTEGLDFVMTAMFVTIFMNQWEKEKSKLTALTGILCSAICLGIFGPSSFMVPTMICVLVVLTAFRKPIAKAGDYE